MYSKYSKQEHQEMTEKVLACHGYLNYKSIAEVVGCNYTFVSRVMQKANKKAVPKSYSIKKVEWL